MNFILYKKDSNSPQMLHNAQMTFISHYAAFDWLRDLSYTFQACGCNTTFTERTGEYELIVTRGKTSTDVIAKYLLTEV